MPLPKITNGWGSVYNGGITGGFGGVEVEFTDFVEMWIWLVNNLTTPAIVTYTGPDFNRTGFPDEFPNSTFSNTSRFQAIGLKNKTIRASVGQLLTMCVIVFRDNENVIWENWKHFDSLDDLTRVQSDSINVWIRHCELNGNEFNTATQVDGAVDVVIRSDFVAVTDCLFVNCNKTSLVGASDSATDDRNKLRVTFARNKIQDCIQRKPRVRFGKVGFHYNVVDTIVEPHLGGGAKIIQIGNESQIYSYNNDFKRDRLAYLDSSTDGTGGVFVNGDRYGVLDGGTTAIRPEYVEWSPLTESGYTIDDWTVDEAESWVEQWAGANMHLMTDDETPTIPPVEPSNRRFFARRN